MADATCKQRMDLGSFRFWESYDFNLDKPEAIADLKCCLILARVESIQIDYRSQRARRFTLSRSIQRPQVSLSTLNRFWVHDQVERHLRGWWPLAKEDSAQAAEGTDEARQAPEAQQRRRSTSAYNLFKQKVAGGKRGDDKVPEATVSRQRRELGEAASKCSCISSVIYLRCCFFV